EKPAADRAAHKAKQDIGNDAITATAEQLADQEPGQPANDQVQEHGSSSTPQRRSSSGTYTALGGPTYSDSGLMLRLFSYCARTCAVQPAIRERAKTGVKMNSSRPSP